MGASIQKSNQQNSHSSLEPVSDHLAHLRGVASFTTHRRLPDFIYKLHEFKLGNRKGEEASSGLDSAQKKKIIILGTLGAIIIYLLATGS